MPEPFLSHPYNPYVGNVPDMATWVLHDTEGDEVFVDRTYTDEQVARERLVLQRPLDNGPRYTFNFTKFFKVWSD